MRREIALKLYGELAPWFHLLTHPADYADEADYVVVTAGRFDVLVEVVCADRHGLLDVTNRIRQLPGVVSTESFMYLELWKQLYDWGTGPDGHDAKPAAERTTKKRRSR